MRLSIVGSLAFIVVGCAGQEQPVEKPPLEIAVPTELPKAKPKEANRLAGKKEPPKFVPISSIKGVGGRECRAWENLVAVTQPAGDGLMTMRVREKGNDLDVDCRWEGTARFEVSVLGMPTGLVNEHLVVFKDGLSHQGTLTVVDASTGRISAKIEGVAGPSYLDDTSIRYEVPVAFSMERSEETSCQQQVEEAWVTRIRALDASNEAAPGMERTTPHCPPDMVDRFCDTFAFMIPKKLKMGENRGTPADGVVGCVHVEPTE